MSKFSTVFLTLLLVLIVITSAVAQEFIIDDPVVREKDGFVIDYERVKVNLKDQAAQVEIEQLLKNNMDYDIEATLIFPIPADAGITDLSMTINGELVKGEIMDKDKARGIYEDIVRQMKDPALLEYMGEGLYQISIYPITAKGSTKIVLKYSQLLPSDLGLTEFKLPLTGNSSDWPLEELTLGVELDSSVPIKSFYSPTHKLDVEKEGDNYVKAGFEDTQYEGEEDFLLYYGTGEEDFGLNLLTFRENKDEGGFFLLMASAGEELKEEDILPKDIVFVLDTSGSMEDEDKLVYAEKALAFCLGHLNPEDRFNIITFSSGTDLFSETLVAPTQESAEKAMAFLDSQEALGGTNINEALGEALKLFSGKERPNYIVFLTDGLPTQGETDVDTILKNISDENKSGVRIFSFGVGTDVNTLLLDLTAEQNKGYTSYLEAGEEMEVEVSSFFTKINYPVLSNLALDFGSVNVKDVYPKELPDLFRGSQILVFGRYTTEGHTAITLSGEVNGEKKSYVYEKIFAGEDTDNTFIPPLWATRKIGYLLNEIRLHGENDETVDEIVELSLRYGVITPYTSFLVQEELNRDEGEAMPVNEDDIYSSMPYTYGYNSSTTQDASGGANVATSEKLDSYQEAQVLPAAPPSVDGVPSEIAMSVQTVADKTFYFKKDKWIDSVYVDGTDTVEIEFGSDAYFELLKTYPSIGKYLSVGDNMVLVYEGKTYHIFTR